MRRFFFSFGICMCSLLATYGQESSLNTQVSFSLKNVSLDQALRYVSDNYHLTFSYGNNVIPLNKKVSIKAQNEPLSLVLDRFFSKQNIAYRYIGGQIALKIKEPPPTPKKLLQTIRGYIRDIDTQVPLEAASVFIPALQIGTFSDESGAFRLDNVPIGRHDLHISYLGYKDRSLHVLLNSAKEEVLNIDLLESTLQAQEVIIEEDRFQKLRGNEISPISSRTFSVEETQRFACSFDNPAYMITAFAGVRGGDDASDNEIVIRGNAPRLIQWQIEGIEVPSPNHFTSEGTANGAISMLSSNMLSYSNFFTGGFSAEYGNAISGIFDIRLRNGNNNKQEYALGASLLGVDFAAEGPFQTGKKASYLVNYRYSSLDLLKRAGIDVVPNETPVYQDLSFKLYFPTKRAGTFSVFGIGGSSYTEYADTELATDGRTIFDYENFFYSDMGVLGVKHDILLNENTLLKNAFSVSAYQIGLEDIYQERQGIIVSEGGEEFVNINTRINNTLIFKPHKQHVLKLGAISSFLSYDLYSFDRDTSLNFIFVDAKGSSFAFQGFANWRAQLNEKLTLNSGLHYMYFAFNQRHALEPRLSLNWQLSPKQNLAAGFGLHSKRQAFSTYTSNSINAQGQFYQPNLDLDLIRALHVALSYDLSLRKDLRVKAEAYYQNLYNVPVLQKGALSNHSDDLPGSFVNLNSDFSNEPLESTGEAINYGLELTVEKFFSRSYYFLLTASLFESFYATADGEYFNTRFNGNIIANGLAGKEFPLGENAKLDLNIRTVVAGGKRETDIDLEASRELGYTVRTWNKAFEAQLPTYFRTDLSAGLAFNQKKVSHQWKIDIRNITNRQHTASSYYSKISDRIITFFGGKLLPVASYKILF